MDRLKRWTVVVRNVIIMIWRILPKIWRFSLEICKGFLLMIWEGLQFLGNTIVIFWGTIFKPLYKRFPPSIQWFLYELTPIRIVWEKIFPPPDLEGHRRPATFGLWIIAVYVALFGVASSRYENRVDIIEVRASSIFAQLSSSDYKGALGRIPRVQQMKCPRK